MMSVAIARRNDTTDPAPSEPACPERFVGAGEAPTGRSGCLKANDPSLRSDSCALDYNDLVTHLLALRRERLIALCKKHRVRRLEVFGSAARSDFDPESSDFDLLVEAEFTRDRTFQDYLGDALLRSGVERQLEIIGEALRAAVRHEPEFEARMTDVAAIIAFRNQLTHADSAVDHRTVWGLLERRVPQLRSETARLLQQLGAG